MKTLVHLSLGGAIGTWAAQARNAFDQADWFRVVACLICMGGAFAAVVLFVRAR